MYWVGNLVLSQKFGNFSRINAAFFKLLFVIFQYHQTVSLHPRMHRTVWRTFLLKQNRAQTWPPWPKFATPFYANGFTFSSENLSDISRYHTLFKTHFWRFLKKLHCWVVGSYVVFRLPVSCAQFHCSSTFLHGIRQIPARFIKTVMFSCQNDSFMLFSWMWRIALDKHYNSILCCHAGMTKFTLGCSTTE